MPDYENMSDITKQLRVGAVVEHEAFGRGKILSIAGKGESMKAAVFFESAGVKQLMVKYAKLTLV